MRRWILIAGLGASVACAVAATTDDGGVDASSDAMPPKDASVDATKDATTTDSSASDAPNDVTIDVPTSTFATLQVNEVAPNITGSEDLIELLAVQGGSIAGITVEQDITTKLVFVTLPAITVATGDYIVVHLNAPSGVTAESTSKTDCSNAACYSSAWDVIGGVTGITYSGRVILTRAPDSGIQDGVAFFRTGTASPATFFDQVEALQDAGQWLPADCSGNPCSTNALAQAISAQWAGTSTTLTTSVSRSGNADTNTAADWKVAASSFGTTNP